MTYRELIAELYRHDLMDHEVIVAVDEGYGPVPRRIRGIGRADIDLVDNYEAYGVREDGFVLLTYKTRI